MSELLVSPSPHIQSKRNTTALMNDVLIALLPAAYLLCLTGNIDNIWLCFLIAEFMSLLCSTIFLKKTLKDVDKKLSAQANTGY